MKKNALLIISTMVLAVFLCCPNSFADVRPPIDTGSEPGGGSSTSYYLTNFESISNILTENGYSSSNAEFISANATSSSGICTVTQVHGSILQVTVRTREQERSAEYHLFVKYLINGKVIELRVINTAH